MTAHSLVAYRSDAERDAGIQFEDEPWQRFVPQRLPWTVCVQERLPPGSAAVLLNRAHPFHDLVLPIDTLEKRMFDAIDGRRSIAEIVERQKPSNDRDRARAFFGRLWWYDQVVFDRSTAR
jgi:hypothetical protein